MRLLRTLTTLNGRHLLVVLAGTDCAVVLAASANQALGKFVEPGPKSSGPFS